MRIILFTGKGGVGKTTIAAATAYQASKGGSKTLVISTDPAHSLSDALDYNLGPEPVEIAHNLFAQELDVYYSMQKYWKNIRELMLTIFRWQGLEHVLAEEMSALPGMEEASAFLWIEKFYREKEYELIVIDSAPTGETLTLLTLPQVTKWWITKAFPFEKFAIKNIGRVARYTTGIPLDKGYEELGVIFDKLEEVQKIFGDKEICSIRLVANPERMVINETKRAYTYLNLYGYNVDAMIINKVVPREEGSKLFQKYFSSQEKYLEEISEAFSNLPIMKVPHLGQDVFGLNALNKIGQLIYQEQSPTDVFHHDESYLFEQKKDGYLLKIKLPNLDESGFSLNKYGDEIVIQIGNKRRNFFLPRFVNFFTLDEFEYDNPWLIIHLKK